ncbi:MAG: hydroxymethylglutaryl-CoA lyase [Gammaproteobacteria bacterium]
MSLPEKIKLVEVGPRDGLQNESRSVPTAIKLEFIKCLSQTGLQVIETTSFVSKKKIPQLADHKELFQALDKNNNITYSALVPNMQGFITAKQVGVTEIAIFTAASESFTGHNINCSIAQSLQNYGSVISAAKAAHIRVRGYISCSLGCPYEGHIAPQKVVDIAEKLWALGCDEICLGDTIGIATANEAQLLVDAVKKKIPREHIALHFHDTYGQALANIYATLQQGITIFDCSVSGLGGCPYAPGATGNVASEDVVYMLNGLGIETGIDLDKLIVAGQYIDKFLQRNTGSKVTRALR